MSLHHTSSPDVEPGRPARRRKLSQEESGGNYLRSLENIGVVPGGKMRALYVRRDARRHMR